MAEKFPARDPAWWEAGRDMAVSAEALSTRLGFFETEELARVRLHLTEAMTVGDEETVKSLIADYYTRGERAIDEQEGDDYGRAQIGLMLALALARRDSGRMEDYLNDLTDALEYAANMQYDEAADLRRIRTEVINSFNQEWY